jgi:hypothetical protein
MRVFDIFTFDFLGLDFKFLHLGLGDTVENVDEMKEAVFALNR